MGKLFPAASGQPACRTGTFLQQLMREKPQHHNLKGKIGSGVDRTWRIGRSTGSPQPPPWDAMVPNYRKSS
jgi:hypothetical protein